MHSHDDERNQTFRGDKRPLLGKLTPGQAKYYWKTLGDKGKQKYGNWMALVKDSMKSRRNVQKGEPSGEGRSDKVVSNPQEKHEVWRESPAKRLPEDDQLATHLAKVLVPADSAGGLLRGASSPRKMVNPEDGKAYAVKNYATTDPQHGDNRIRSEHMAGDFARFFGFAMPQSMIARGSDFTSKHPDGKDKGLCLITPWVAGKSLTQFMAYKNISMRQLADLPAIRKSSDAISRLVVMDMFSGMQDSVGPLGANIQLTGQNQDGSLEMVPIDLGGNGFNFSKGLIDEYGMHGWLGETEVNPIVGINNPGYSEKAAKRMSMNHAFPFMGIRGIPEDGVERVYAYIHNAMSPLCRNLNDEHIAKAINMLSGMSDGFIDKSLSKSGFSDITGKNGRTYSPEKYIGEVLKDRRDFMLLALDRFNRGFPLKDIPHSEYHQFRKEKGRFSSHPGKEGMLKFLVVIDPSIMSAMKRLADKGYPVHDIKARLGSGEELKAYSESHFNYLKSVSSMLPLEGMSVSLALLGKANR